MRATVTESEYNLTEEQASAHPFGRGSSAIQEPSILALGQRLTAARRAVEGGAASEEQRMLLSQMDAAMRRAAAARSR